MRARLSAVTALSVLAPLLLALLPVVVSAPSAAAAGDRLYAGRDKAGDVRRFGQITGLSRRDRNSIDLRRAWVHNAGKGRLRLTVKIRRVAPRRVRWDQAITFTTSDPRTTDLTAVVSFTQARSHGSAAYDVADGTYCEGLRIIRRPKQRTLSTILPKRCRPANGDRVRVSSAATQYGTDGLLWSTDRMRAGTLG